MKSTEDLFVTVIEVVTVTLIKNVTVMDVKAVNMMSLSTKMSDPLVCKAVNITVTMSLPLKPHHSIKDYHCQQGFHCN
jgi:hypothetical protein